MNGNMWRLFAVIGSMGMEIVLLTLGGAWLGKKLDTVWGTRPYLLMAGVLLGLGVGFFSAIYTLKALLKE